MMKNTSLADSIGRLYLLYLSLLPALGTFTVFFVLKTRMNPMVFFLLGTAAIGIYLAFTGSYTVLTKSAWKNALLLIDGPLWMLVSLWFGGSLAHAVVQTTIVEIGGALLSVLLVVCTSSVPSPRQRRQSLIAVGLPFLGIVAVLLTVMAEQHIPWSQGGFLAAAIVQGAFAQYRLGLAMEVQRSSETMILTGILSWMFAFCILWPVLEFVLTP